MKFLLAFVLLFSLTLGHDSSWNIEPAIIGGTNTGPNVFPFMAAVHWVTNIPSFASRLVCGGVVLSRRWVLTAAHCITESPKRVRLDVILGMHAENLAETGRDRLTIDRNSSIIHPDWVAGKTGPDDLALLFLPHVVTFSTTIQPINLPEKNSAITGNGIAIGWGSASVSGMGTSNVRMRVQLPFITNTACRGHLAAVKADPNLLDEKNVCTGPVVFRGVQGGTCSGDGGGPIIQTVGTSHILRGITSWTLNPCAQPNAPSGIFKRVSLYVDWIENVTGI